MHVFTGEVVAVGKVLNAEVATDRYGGYDGSCLVTVGYLTPLQHFPKLPTCIRPLSAQRVDTTRP